ncbi:MAG TPA: FIST N-terminal domain-containing protein [Solirubrobacteraceae bacterium]|jgi:small ligand-binding sensory domain FIST|nr:FIST N-terminal domain-containing protein [Solirubrobacteraceae bacterium]
MGVRIGCGLSTAAGGRSAAIAAAQAAVAGLGGGPVDLAVVFASGSHLAAPEATLEGVHEAIDPAALIGCGAAGVLAEEREIEDETAVAVWVATLGGGSVETFHATASTDGFTGLPSLAGASGLILLPDPYSFPTDALLPRLHAEAPGVPVLGGLSSARTFDETGALFVDETVYESGMVGARLEGVEMLPCVSQGAAPLGPELTITRCDGHVIHELAGKPALAKLREIFLELDERERGLVDGGLLLGLVIDAGKPEYVQGDFLVRGLLGGDPEEGSIAVGADVRTGQVVRLHARDAPSADRDLREALALRRTAMGGREPAGALMFTCNGRGKGMFGIPDHDAETVASELGPVPTAGFFAAGEIGPVGGQSFLHGFTATIAVFPAGG